MFHNYISLGNNKKMVDYTLVFLPMVLSMATTAHCSWISRGAPPTAHVGDYVAIGDDFVFEEKDGLAPGPSTGSLLGEKGDEAPGPDVDFMIQEKDAHADGIIANEEEFITQEKDNVPSSDETIIIQGKVYCAPCRIQFPTKISYPLPKTKITLVRHKETGEESYRLEGTSDDKGRYILTAVGDHAEEVCEISVSESPDPNCPELMDDENHVRVSLTNKHGVRGKGRYANPLGFMTTNADPRCKEALDELGFTGI